MIALTDNMVAAYIGSDEVTKVYLGSDLVWEKQASVLPYDAELEYIQTDGQAYFTLPVAPSEATDAIEITSRRTNTTTQQRYCSATGETTFQVYVNSSNRLAYSRNNNWTAMNASDRTLLGAVKHTLKVDYYAKKCSLDFYVVSIGTTSKAATGNLRVLCPYSSYTGIIGEIYSVKFWRSGTLLYDLIPVRKNGVPYFYDKINGVLYPSEGTGTWTAGYDKKTSLSDYTQIDYIQNTSTAANAPYIDTGISNDATDANIQMQMTVKWNSVDSSKDQRFGSTYLVMWGCYQGVWNHAYLLDDTDLTDVTPSTSEYVTVKSMAFTGTPTYKCPIALFRKYQGGKRSNGDTTYICRCSVSSYKIWVGGTLVRDFIPVIHPANVYGMWDLVEGKFYPSANSGSFTGGNFS